MQSTQQRMSLWAQPAWTRLAGRRSRPRVCASRNLLPRGPAFPHEAARDSRSALSPATDAQACNGRNRKSRDIAEEAARDKEFGRGQEGLQVGGWITGQRGFALLATPHVSSVLRGEKFNTSHLISSLKKVQAGPARSSSNSGCVHTTGLCAVRVRVCERGSASVPAHGHIACLCV